MMEAVMKAFEVWDREKFRLGEMVYPFCSAESICMQQIRVAEARDGVMDAMDRWYEWKRMNGPQNPGK